MNYFLINLSELRGTSSFSFILQEKSKWADIGFQAGSYTWQAKLFLDLWGEFIYMKWKDTSGLSKFLLG